MYVTVLWLLFFVEETLAMYVYVRKLETTKSKLGFLSFSFTIFCIPKCFLLSSFISCHHHSFPVITIHFLLSPFISCHHHSLPVITIHSWTYVNRPQLGYWFWCSSICTHSIKEGQHTRDHAFFVTFFNRSTGLHFLAYITNCGRAKYQVSLSDQIRILAQSGNSK